MEGIGPPVPSGRLWELGVDRSWHRVVYSVENNWKLFSETKVVLVAASRKLSDVADSPHTPHTPHTPFPPSFLSSVLILSA